MQREELTLPAAKDIAQKAFFDNSNELYSLNLTFQPLKEPDLTADSFSERTLAQFFKSKGIDFVCIQWVDYCNLIVFSILQLRPQLLTLAMPGPPCQTIPLLHHFRHKEIRWSNESGIWINSSRLAG